MSEFENIQQLIRLKRYETPGEDFVEDFVTQFRERQRSELLRQSARDLLWERVTTYFHDLVTPRWAMATATASIAVLAAWGMMSLAGGSNATSSIALSSAEVLPAGMSKQPSLAVDSQLIREAEQGRQLEIEGILLSRHFESEDAEPDVVSVYGAASMPTSAELLPVSFSGINR